MSSALRKPMTLEAFLAWEERQELRYEFDGAGPVAMNGGRLAHEWIVGALGSLLRAKLAGSACGAFGPTAKIVVDGRVRYPDAIVTSSPQDYSKTIVERPVVVFEVIIPGCEHVDRIVKFKEYQRTASIQRYVILEQDSIGATVFTRRGDLWAAEALGAGGVLALPDAGIEVPLDACYAGLPMPADPAPDDAPPA